MKLDKENLREIIRARLARTRIYLEKFLKDLPMHLVELRHRLEHPISELYILIQQLLHKIDLTTPPPISLPEGVIPEDINYFDLALNEIKTALLYFKQRDTNEIFEEIQDYYLEQKLSRILKRLKDFKESIDG